MQVSSVLLTTFRGTIEIDRTPCPVGGNAVSNPGLLAILMVKVSNVFSDIRIFSIIQCLHMDLP